MGYHTFYFAPEIEESVVSTVWRDPKYLQLFYEEHDHNRDLAQKHCRCIMDAINLVYSRIGALDFASVVQCTRELGAYEECGGLDGLNHVYKMAELTLYTDIVFRDHLRSLSQYTAGRAVDPPLRTFLFSHAALARTASDMVDAYRRCLECDKTALERSDTRSR